MRLPSQPMKKVDSYHKGVKLLGAGDEADVILDFCCEEEQVSIVTSGNYSNEFFYVNLHIIHELWVLIPFTLFDFEVLTTMNVAYS